LSLFLITCLVIFSNLFEIAASHRQTLPSKTFFWYLALNEWMILSLPFIHLDIEEEFKKGIFSAFLVRPISYIGAKIAEGSAQVLVHLIFLGFVTFVFASLWTESFPFSVGQMVLLLFFTLLAAFLGVISYIILGLMSFWFEDIVPWIWVFEKLCFVLGGLTLPLVVYPQFLQTIASFTPFPAILGAKSELVLEIGGMSFSLLLTMCIVWIILFLSLAKMVFKLGEKSFNTKGG